MTLPSFDNTVVPPRGFSLAQTCGPVAWAKGRWPAVDWIDGTLVWMRRDGDRVATRWARQASDGRLEIGGDRDPRFDCAWAEAVLGLGQEPPTVGDPVVVALAARYPGLRPFSSGSLFDGIVSCIAGQSITVMAAAVTERRIAELFHPGTELAGRRFWPPPSAEQLADADPALIRTSGVTWRRAEAIVAAARAECAGEMPANGAIWDDPEGTRAALRRLPLVGPWTAESTLLWGVGYGDAYPPRDAALLRAARAAYGDTALDHTRLDRLADGWRPGRAWAARWLWTALFGPATEVASGTA